ncbi:hypothetical protein PanWU01x14_146350 [Parasponia andersonii]|uniref:Uncharacterized protein n=1 Tax=Parasponia andersonii TaxID=3476 RepID=A0A2P5CJP3_PARAD|nr:hypothetical protein PanWU01x14_146350 [Parasponia andersonii]
MTSFLKMLGLQTPCEEVLKKKGSQLVILILLQICNKRFSMSINYIFVPQVLCFPRITKWDCLLSSP